MTENDIPKPTDKDEFAELYKEQIERAKNGEEPLSPEEMAERYQQNIIAAREQMDGQKELRNYFIRRCYEMFDGVTVKRIAEAFELTTDTINNVVNKDPTIEKRGKPDIFKDE